MRIHKLCCWLFGVLGLLLSSRGALAQPAEPEAFPYSTHPIGKEVLKRLHFAEKGFAQLESRLEAKRLPPLSKLDQALVPFAERTSQLARGNLKPAPQVIAPRSLSEGLPLARQEADARVPVREKFATMLVPALPAVDLEIPVPLPFVGRPKTDRAPLNDPTAVSSVATALAAEPPLRDAPALAPPVNVPDPFPYQLTAPALPESLPPPSAAVRLPKK